MLISSSVVETITTSTSFVVSTFTETPSTTFYTGTITGAARKREEPSSSPPLGGHRRNAQLLDGLVRGLINLPGKHALTNVIVDC